MPILISHHNACGTSAKHAPRFCNLAHCATTAAAGFRQQAYHCVAFHWYFNWYSTTEAQRCTDIQSEMLILLIKCFASVSFQFWLPLFLYQRLCGAIVWGATPIIQGNTAKASCALMAGINKSNCVRISQQQAEQPLRRVYWRLMHPGWFLSSFDFLLVSFSLLVARDGTCSSFRLHR